MTILPFTRSYIAWDQDPDDSEWPMLECINSATGERAAIDYAGVRVVSYHPGDTMAILHCHCIVTMEGQCLAALHEPLAEHRIRTIRTFAADIFRPPAPGTPLVERLTIVMRPPTPEDWERWVYTR